MAHEYRHSGERHIRDSAYLERIHPDIGPVLLGMEAEADRDGLPITERPSTRLLSLVVRAMGARRALEIGTNIGYSAIAIASALGDGGELVTLDIDEEMHERARANADRAGVGDRVTLVTGPALETLAEIEGPFDFVYIDADKGSYPQYLDAAVEKAAAGRRGGAGQPAVAGPGGARAGGQRLPSRVDADHPGLQRGLPGRRAARLDDRAGRRRHRAGREAGGRGRFGTGSDQTTCLGVIRALICGGPGRWRGRCIRL